MKRVIEWPDEVYRMCREVAESPTLMALLQELSDGSSSLRLIAMRDAVGAQDYPKASRLEAEARAWEDMPLLIRDLADQFRQRNRG